MPSPIAPPVSLSTGQVVLLIGIGIAVWFVVALLLAALAPLGVYAGTANLLLYALIVPGTVPLILLIRTLTRARRDQTLTCVTIVTATASLLDGNALLRLPVLYGASPAGAGATLLWGVGVALALSVVMSRPAQQ